MGCYDLNEFKEQIENGALARVGLLDATTIGAATALLKRVADSDLETVRVLFADQHGILRGKTIVADALPLHLYQWACRAIDFTAQRYLAPHSFSNLV